MSLYIVDYDLSNPGQNYGALIVAIKQYSGWAKICESSWAITIPTILHPLQQTPLRTTLTPNSSPAVYSQSV